MPITRGTITTTSIQYIKPFLLESVLLVPSVPGLSVQEWNTSVEKLNDCPEPALIQPTVAPCPPAGLFWSPLG